MLIYSIRRILILVPLSVFISFLIYLGLELTPGDAVSHLISPDTYASMNPAELEALRESLGLGQPFLLRYWIWLSGILQGDFGYTSTGGVPIARLFMQRLPATLELSFAALLISTILGSILGVISALRRGTGTDHVLTIIGMIGVSIPEFFFGLVAILVFSLKLGWLPVGGRLDAGYTSYLDHMPNLVLPALTLSIMMTAGVMRYARSSMLDSLSREFIRTARSKGIPEWRVNLIHGFRVALTPVIVLIGFRLPVLIGGTVIIEEVFQWPGMGREFLIAVRAQDYPMVMMVALFSVLAVLAASVIIDLLTALIDPRVRLEGRT